ncbi:Gfo/Idh/MocA family protein [Cognatishimia activa]|uniref:Gfo/Idh/MocA family protein n=1 Tax=Cognatishimia activa TaxID=1715691 RepID=UPI0006F11536|nr:Gfo/Idh/MocA family oxidoreductase [Cognatishimia activa]CUI28460.1 Glucose--fructose oxidoreductase precursor [Cognatishimia activa]
MKPVRWGILGAAKFARQFMGPAIHAAHGAELVALATSSEEKAADFKAFCPTLKVHTDYEALLADPSIDAIYIPLPNHMHVDWTIKALEAGKHVLCEKPIALQDSDFDRLITARDASGKLAAEAFMIVHHPQWQHARELVQSGEIGALRHISGRFSFDNREDTTNIRNRPETGGGGLRDIGVYVMGSTRFVTGLEGSDVSARVRWENGVDVFADISAKFGDATYSAYVSTRMQPAQEMVFHGEKGLIRMLTPFNARVFGEAVVEFHRTGHVGGGSVHAQRFPMDDHYKSQVEAFGRTVRDGADYPCPLEFSRGTKVMMDGVFEVATDLG